MNSQTHNVNIINHNYHINHNGIYIVWCTRVDFIQDQPHKIINKLFFQTKLPSGFTMSTNWLIEQKKTNQNTNLKPN
jgi:hypothetical protein